MSKHAVGKYYVYDDENQLGEGSFGTVFRGHRTQKVDEMVAIKAINLKKSVVKQAGSIFTEREIEISEILTSTRHPNLVLFHCHEKVLSIIYLVMEFCNGGNLFDYLQAQELKTLTEPTIRFFFKQIGAGVKFLHEKGIVHRDLKPENILLKFDGPKYPTPENIQLKIGDFGLGRFLKPDEKATTNCGTYYYMAPEVASENYDKKVDLWSIGVMIYECAGGNKKALGSESVLLPKDVTGTQDLKELLVSGLLVKDPEKRFDCERLMGHRFMLENLHISIHGDTRTREIQITKKSSVDVLYEKATEFFAVKEPAETIVLYLEGVALERGSTVEDARIRNGSKIALVYRQSGGIYKTNQTRTSTSPLTLNLLLSGIYQKSNGDCL